MQTISVEQLHQKIIAGQAPIIIDIRTEEELLLASLPFATHVPPHHLIPFCERHSASTEFYILCHHGIRSARATYMLSERGFTVFNIQGGIHAWSTFVDPKIPTY